MAALPLWRRFPAAHQYLRMRLLDEIYPIAPALACCAEPCEDGWWLITLRWPEIAFATSERFSADELRAVYGRWSDWARGRVFDIADRLPV